MDEGDPGDRPAISDPITIAEAARLLGVHPNTVRNRLKQGVYQFGRVLTPNGEAYVLSRAALETHTPTMGEGPLPSQQAVSLQSAQLGTLPGSLQETLPGTLQGALQAVIAPLVEAHAREVAAKDATIERQAEELGAARERARQAEERAAGLELAMRGRRPWWWRFLGR